MNAIALKFQQLRDDLIARFPERSTVIDGCLASTIASEHVLIIGPPGTAKSQLARAVAGAFGGVYFERLLTKFSTPDEVFGPISLRALEQDRFERVVAGKLPEAEFAFIDEVYKSNSAVLNALLTVMNERLFHNDKQPISCPLVTLFGASNELPEGKDLEALSDRFILRFDVKYVSQLSSMRSILSTPDERPVTPHHEPDWRGSHREAVITMAELHEAQTAAQAIEVTEDTIDGLIAIREACQAEGIIASDRRWKKSLGLVQAVAWMAGQEHTSTEDLVVLTDVLWREPKERHQISRIVSERSDPTRAKVEEVLESAREISKNLNALKAQKQNSNYIGAAAKAIDQYTEQRNQLSELQRSASNRSKTLVRDALTEIQGMQAEASRTISAKLGGRPLSAAEG